MVKDIQNSGFTLIEIMVTLAIAAVGLMALSSALDRSIDTAATLEMKTVANWVASNRMAELRLQRTFRTSGSDVSRESMGGVDWQVVDNFYSTPDPNIARVVVEVFEPEDSTLPVTSNVGFLGKYKPAANQ